MNEAQLDDLKQFITGTVAQTEKRLETKIAELRTEIRAEMADGFAGVGEAIELIHNQLDEHHAECDRRLTRLEQQAA